jgi:hypothetical protein
MPVFTAENEDVAETRRYLRVNSFLNPLSEPAEKV